MAATYFRAVLRKIPAALLDIVLIAGISLFPILIGRVVLIVPSSPHYSEEAYWDFLTNGQIAFYSIGTIAAILIIVFDEKIPKVFAKLLQFGCVAALFFLAVLVGIDPTLKAESFSFVGTMTLGLYLVALLVRALVDAVRNVDEKDAREAGEKATRRTTAGLKERKGVADE